MLPSQINENRISVSLIKWIKLKLKQKYIFNHKKWQKNYKITKAHKLKLKWNLKT